MQSMFYRKPAYSKASADRTLDVCNFVLAEITPNISLLYASLNLIKAHTFIALGLLSKFG